MRQVVLRADAQASTCVAITGSSATAPAERFQPQRLIDGTAARSSEPGNPVGFLCWCRQHGHSHTQGGDELRSPRRIRLVKLQAQTGDASRSFCDCEISDRACRRERNRHRTQLGSLGVELEFVCETGQAARRRHQVATEGGEHGTTGIALQHGRAQAVLKRQNPAAGHRLCHPEGRCRASHRAPLLYGHENPARGDHVHPCSVDPCLNGMTQRLLVFDGIVREWKAQRMELRTRILLPAIVASIGLSASLVGCQAPAGGTSGSVTSEGESTKGAFATLEDSYDARLGVAAIDTESGETVTYRADERFAFASTNKTFIAAATLASATDEELETLVPYSPADLLEYAPVTSRFVNTGMTVRELLDAMLRFSDNTAANILVQRLGGPDAVEQWLRGVGDDTTSVDRLEPDLNEATPGDDRDTTTPSQFAIDLRDVLLGETLDVADRTLLRNTMLHNVTGDHTVRAGVDAAWPVADKTGTGEYGVRNDIAVIYPEGRAPIIIAVLTSKDSPNANPDDALLAAATEIAVDSITR